MKSNFSVFIWWPSYMYIYFISVFLFNLQITISNGLTWSLDRKTFYYIDSFLRCKHWSVVYSVFKWHVLVGFVLCCVVNKNIKFILIKNSAGQSNCNYTVVWILTVINWFQIKLYVLLEQYMLLIMMKKLVQYQIEELQSRMIPHLG